MSEGFTAITRPLIEPARGWMMRPSGPTSLSASSARANEGRVERRPIPPLDKTVPTHTMLATFALG
jgi:hypothetical protein